MQIQRCRKWGLTPFIFLVVAFAAWAQPYPAVLDAVACNVDLVFGAISSGLPYVRSGRLKAVAVTAPGRHPGLPDTPTFAKAGYPAVAMEAYFGMLAPAGTPREIIERLHAEVAAVLKEKATVQRLAGAGLDVAGSSPEEFAARIRWAPRRNRRSR